MIEIRIDILSKNNESHYEAFLKENKYSLLYHSIKYREFLKKILAPCEDIYLIATNNNKIIGVLPLFICRLDDNSSIINSLPFYGSHGGVLVSEYIEDAQVVVELLLDELLTIAGKENCISLNIIDSPFLPMGSFYEKKLKVEPSDYRVSQVTNLEINVNYSLDDELMEKFHSKTRNMVRKSKKYGFNVTLDNTYEGFKTICYFHSENMKAIGGNAKPLSVFRGIYEIFDPEEDYNVYVAKKNNEFAAGLLIFYYKEYCEYFTPVINQKYRSEQPLSLLIFTAMKEAYKRGVKYWNWGGTWSSHQEGVYLFKKRWGADEMTYNYYTKILAPEALKKVVDIYPQSCNFFYLKNLRNNNEDQA